MRNYPRYIEKARSDLGDAFKISDYPDVDVIKSKFKFEFEIQALPSYGTDIRTTASEQVAKRIERDAIKRERRNIENTMRDFVGGIIEQGEHLAENLHHTTLSKSKRVGSLRIQVSKSSRLMFR